MKLLNTIVAFALLFSFGDAFLPKMTGRSITQQKALSFNEDVVSQSNLPGNFGFDPLCFAQTPAQLALYRKAEVKHSRLAILAVVWIMWSDLHVVDKLGVTPLVEGRLFPEFMGACVGLPSAIELYGERVEQDRASDSSYWPGQLDLDPLQLYPNTSQKQRQVQFAEIMSGRVCMIAAASRLTENLLASMGFLGEDENLVSFLMPVQTTMEEVTV